MTRLLISFSGGRTSGYMTRRLLTECAGEYEMLVVFANTGEENEATLEFVHACDTQFGFGTVWVEAVTDPRPGVGTRHRVVTFETASRHGEPFEAMIAKYGIPNTAHPHCTKFLKRRAIESYAKSVEWRDGYAIALGIRVDERRRAKPALDREVVYPLVDRWPVDKAEVNEWWSEQPFDLQLQEHEGNCKWCWKKSFRKHARLIAERPQVYDFPARMEAQYGHVMPPDEAERRKHALLDVVPRRAFFREGTSTALLFKRCAILPPWQGPHEKADENGGCTESCELFPMEDE